MTMSAQTVPTEAKPRQASRSEAQEQRFRSQWLHTQTIAYNGVVASYTALDGAYFPLMVYRKWRTDAKAIAEAWLESPVKMLAIRLWHTNEDDLKTGFVSGEAFFERAPILL